jgi:aminopeptidase-like protein
MSRGVYSEMGSADQTKRLAMLWVLTLSDGTHSSLDIAEKSCLDFELIRGVADILTHCGVLEELG